MEQGGIIIATVYSSDMVLPGESHLQMPAPINILGKVAVGFNATFAYHHLNIC